MLRRSVSSQDPPDALNLRLLGSFALDRAGQTLSLPTRKIESLLAYLVLHPQAHAREALATLFWGDSPDEQARLSLRYALAMLRKIISADLLVANRDTVQFNPDAAVWVDAVAFRRGTKEMQDLSGSLSINQLQSAIQLYRGDLLADYYDGWIAHEREYYNQLYLAALLQLTQAYRSTSEYARAIETAQRLLKSDPANERAHQHLMFCFVAVGNRHAALSQYIECVNALREHLGVDPLPETTALHEWIKQARSESPSLTPRLTNLPIPLTSFIGRESVMVESKKLLTEDGQFARDQLETGETSSPSTSPVVRLLTLTGAGGSGKTRLAIQVATDLIDSYRDGVWWVELAGLTDGALVPYAVAKALGVQEAPPQPLFETLTHFLREKQLLLVIDNCEHLLDACAQLTRTLLGACPHLQIVATSREPMGFIGETVRTLPTLSFPDPNTLSLTNLLMQFEAIRLFVERARAIDSEFTLSSENAPAVAQICARLDGIPLALELAAARAYELDVEEIAEHLAQRFMFLTRGNRGALPRQQTLDALITWSYDLLSPREQLLFRRLSIFAASFTAQAAEMVCEPWEGEVIELLPRLVTKSLVTLDRSDSESRFRLLETLREYGYNKLVGMGEEQELQERHAAFFIELAETVEPDVYGARQEDSMLKLEDAHNDVRAALRCAVARSDASTVLRLSAAVGIFWERRGFWNEGREWAEQAVALNRDLEFDTLAPTARKRAYAQAMMHAGAFNWRVGNFSAARDFFERSLRLYREMEDSVRYAHVLSFLGGIDYEQGENARALEEYRESLELYRTAGDLRAMSDSLCCMGLVLANMGDYDAAMRHQEESLALAREVGDPFEQGFALNAMGETAYAQGAYSAAVAFFTQSLELRRKLGERRGIASTLLNLGAVETKRGSYKSAREYLEVALMNYREIDNKRGVASAISKLALLEHAQGYPESAVKLLSAGQTLLESIHARLDTSSELEIERAWSALRNELGDAVFESAREEGRELSPEQVFRLAAACRNEI